MTDYHLNNVLFEETSKRFFVVFRKNFPYFKENLSTQDYYRLLKEVQRVLSEYQSGKKNKKSLLKLQNSLFEVVAATSCGQDFSNILLTGTRRGNANQEEKDLGAIKNSVEELAKIIEAETNSGLEAEKAEESTLNTDSHNE